MSDTSNIVLPEGSSIHPSHRLVTWHPHGLLNATRAREILRFIEAQEQSATEPFHRFADTSGLDAIHLTFADVEELAQSRIDSYQGPPVQSAILARNPLAFGIARMYEQLMRRSPIELRVFTKLSAAADWLHVPRDVLGHAP